MLDSYDMPIKTRLLQEAYHEFVKICKKHAQIGLKFLKWFHWLVTQPQKIAGSELPHIFF